MPECSALKGLSRCPSPKNFLVACDIGTSKICVLIGEQNASGIPRRDRQGLGAPTAAPARATSSTSTPRSRRSSGPPRRPRSWRACRSPAPGWASRAPTSGRSTAAAWSPWPGRTGRSPRRTSPGSSTPPEACRSLRIMRSSTSCPRDFAVDGQDGVADPLGMIGSRLEADVHVVTAPGGRHPEHRDLHEQGGHRGRPARPRAVRRGRGRADARREGARDLPRRHRRRHDRGRRLPEGHDRPHGGDPDRRRPLHQRPRRRPARPDHGRRAAQEEVRAARCAAAVSEDEMVEVPMVGGRAPKLCPRTTLADILQPRAEELLGLIHEDIQRLGLDKEVRSGVVLTGGGSELEGIVEIAEGIFDGPVRRGVPSGVGGLVDVVSRPEWATATGSFAVRSPLQAGAAPGPGVLPRSQLGFPVHRDSFDDDDKQASATEGRAHDRVHGRRIRSSRSSWTEATPRPATIRVIGVGGGGSNAVNRMISAGVQRRRVLRLQHRPPGAAQVRRAEQAADRRRA